MNGATATLADGPVMCSALLDAGTDIIFFNTYMLSSSNGLQLNGAISGTSMLNGIACSFESTIAATR